MRELVLPLFAGANITIAIMAFYFAYKIREHRFYYFFGLFSFFSGLYFLLSILEVIWQNNLSPLIILSAGLYYSIFPWFIFDFIGKKFTVLKIIVAIIFGTAVVMYLFENEGQTFAIWQIIAHLGLVSLIAITGFAANDLYKRKLKGATELMILTLVFGLLGFEEIISEYTSLEIFGPMVNGMLPLDIYPILFVIIFGLRLSNELVDGQRLQLKLMHAEIKAKEYELELAEKKRIEFELQNKNKDLTDFGLDLVRKKEFTQEVYKKILILKNNNPEFTDLVEILNLTKSHLQIDNELDYFQQNIESVNHLFTSQLQNNYPSLSKNELQMASMLRIGLSSKQIAAIKNVSPDSVKVLRYRLRKKLNLKPKQDLIKFMQEFS